LRGHPEGPEQGSRVRVRLVSSVHLSMGGVRSEFRADGAHERTMSGGQKEGRLWDMQTVPGEYVEVLGGEGHETRWRCVFCKKEHTSGDCRTSLVRFLGLLGGGLACASDFGIRCFTVACASGRP
jgi:hypothetical protein